MQKKRRVESGLFIVEGLAHIETARDFGWEIDTLLFFDAPPEGFKSVSLIQVTPDIITHITGKDNPQPVIAVLRQKQTSLTIAGKILALEGVRDPGNLGTIIRTAAAVGVDALVLLGETCDPWSPEVIRATTGSFARTSLVRSDVDDFLAWKEKCGIPMYGTDVVDGALDYKRLEPQASAILAMGSESNGLSLKMQTGCDYMVHIPMRPGIESLNLSVATGILLYKVFAVG